LENVQQSPGGDDPTYRPPRRKPQPADSAPPPRPPRPEPQRTSSPLPPGHVRKKATGELGKVQAVDSKAGTATVLWLKSGRASTVPLTAITRR
jgi:hypothetical protein